MIFRFSSFELDTEMLELTDAGQAVPVEPQVFSLLAFLVLNHARVVSKNEVIDAIWDGRVISDSAVASRINAARQAVGDDGRQQRIIRTLPKRRFRFVGDITSVSGTNTRNGSEAERPTIAILPFANQSSDPRHSHLADGMFEDISMALSRIRWLQVISSSTTATYADQLPDAQQLGRDLDVQYVLRSSFRQMGGRIRVHVELTDCRNGRASWADNFDSNLTDAKEVYDLLDDMVASAAAAIEQALGKAEQGRARRTRPENLDTWLTCQMGLARMREDAATAGRAEVSELFDAAIGLDENFALAHAGRAFSEYWNFVEGKESYDLELAQIHADKAMVLDPYEGFVHLAAASIEWCKKNNLGAISGYQRALELNPSMVWASHHLAITYLSENRPLEAQELIKNSIRLSPRDTLIGIFYAGYALSCLVLEDDLGCVKWGTRALPYPQPRWVQAYVLSAMGHLGLADDAREMRGLIARQRPEFSIRYIKNGFRLLDGAPKARFLAGLQLAGLRRD